MHFLTAIKIFFYPSFWNKKKTVLYPAANISSLGILAVKVS